LQGGDFTAYRESANFIQWNAHRIKALSRYFLILVKFHFLSSICASSSFELAFGDKSPDPP
jgi:hypothetical protein